MIIDQNMIGIYIKIDVYTR